MACLDNQVWKQAQLACNARLQQAASVKGFGYAATGVAGLRGLGFTITGSIDPSSIIGYATPTSSPSPSPTAPMSQSAIASMAAQAAAQAAASNSRSGGTPAILSSPIDPNDPCSVASQLPCGGPDSCPPGQVHTCERLPKQALNGKWGLSATICSCSSPAAAPAAPIPGGTIVSQKGAAGGFSHWGLLAALAVGGGALYLVMRKKS
jgi:hypothetical protein